MKQITIKNEDVAFIESMLNNPNVTTKWSSRFGKEHCTISYKRLSFSIQFPRTKTGTFVVNVKNPKLYDTLENIYKTPADDTSLTWSVFLKDSLTLVPDAQRYSHIIKEISDVCKKAGIEKIKTSKMFDNSKMLNCVETQRTLIISYNNTSSDIIKGLQKVKLYNMLAAKTIDVLCPTPLENERVKDIKIEDHFVGLYYMDRNVVFVANNIFDKMGDMFLSIEENADFYKWLKTITTACKMVKCSVDSIKTKLMVSLYLKDVNEKVINAEKVVDKTVNDISSHEQKLISLKEMLPLYISTLTALETMSTNGHDMFLKELSRAKDCKLLESVKLKSDGIYMTFKPTTIKAPISRDLSNLNSGDVYEMYIGRITFHITLDRKLRVTCDTPMVTGNNNHHPHCSGTDPCLGSTTAIKMLYEMISQYKFVDAAYIMWMWIRRYRYEDCYAKPYIYFDDRLIQGLPVFDSSGTRIKINDDKLIKKEVQITLTPGDKYKDNIKKFKNFKPQQ